MTPLDHLSEHLQRHGVQLVLLLPVLQLPGENLDLTETGDRHPSDVVKNDSEI